MRTNTRNWLIQASAWCTYIFLVATIEAFSVRVEYARNGLNLEPWEPFLWEFSSGLSILLLIPLLLSVDRRFPLVSPYWARTLPLHLLATLLFSVLHITMMVVLRKTVYWIVGSHYDFGDLASEFLYEYRKDFFSYFFILGVAYLWRGWQMHTAGAHYVPASEAGRGNLVGQGGLADATRSAQSAESVKMAGQAEPLKFRVRKGSREYAIDARCIEWVEAAGNYVLLHAEGGTHPLRDTMKGIAERLGGDFVRVHRSAIVNRQRVAELETGAGQLHLRLANGARVPCGRSFRAEVDSLLPAPP